jgi:hypothetical protein
LIPLSLEVRKLGVAGKYLWSMAGGGNEIADFILPLSDVATV